MKAVGVLLNIVLVLLVGLLLLGGVAPNLLPGQVTSVQGGTAEYVIRAALEGRAGSVILNYGNKYVFAAALQGGWGFVNVNTAMSAGQIGKNMAQYGGNLANAETFGDLVNCLKGLGWKVIPAREVGFGGTLALMASWASSLFRRRTMRRATK